MTLFIEPWKVYWRLTVLYKLPKPNRECFVMCRCTCWNEKKVRFFSLKEWNTTSCGCFRKEKISILYKTHWMTNSKIYKVYLCMKKRCNNIKNKDYKRYWGRGIKCEWKSFDEFYNDMFPTYKEWLEIDRINNDWNYCKDNCKWSTRKEQVRNTSKTIMYNWVPLIQICEERWLKHNTIVHRIYLWWSIEDAINLPRKTNKYV